MADQNDDQVDQLPYDATNSNRSSDSSGGDAPQPAITVPQGQSSDSDSGGPVGGGVTLSINNSTSAPFVPTGTEELRMPVQNDFDSPIVGRAPAVATEDIAPQSHNPFAAIKRGVKNFIHKLSGDDEPASVPAKPSAPNRRSMNLEASTALATAGLGAAGLDNWQAILHAHADCNAAGRPIDDGGKEINLRDMNPEFGRKLAQTCIDLDSAGYQGQYSILSGVRTHEEQLGLYNYYKGIGSSHPVAKPGTSPHEWGVATDLQFKGSGSKENFYRVMHEKGRNNGMEFVAGDENHIQLANAHQVIAQLRTDRNSNTLLAANRRPAEVPTYAS